jgi:hypothetical protein
MRAGWMQVRSSARTCADVLTRGLTFHGATRIPGQNSAVSGGQPRHAGHPQHSRDRGTDAIGQRPRHMHPGNVRCAIEIGDGPRDLRRAMIGPALTARAVQPPWPESPPRRYSPDGRQDRQRNGEILVTAFLRQVGRREVDDHPLWRERQAKRPDRRPHPVLTLARRLSGKRTMAKLFDPPDS